MKIRHQYGDKEIRVQAGKHLVDCSTAQHGEYFYLPLSQEATSQYSGLHHLVPNNDGWDVYKTLYDFGMLDNIQEVVKDYKTNTTTIITQEGCISYQFTEEGLHIVSQKKLTLRFDCRNIYEYDTNQRLFTCEKTSSGYLLTYEKKDQGAHTTTISLITKNDIELKQNWEEVHHSYDERRQNQPTSWFVYNLGQLQGPCSVFIRINGNKPTPHKPLPFAQEGNEKSFTLHAAKASLQQLTITQEVPGIFAGLPWFFHWWTRDESISLCGHDNEMISTVVERYSKLLQEDGRLPNRFPPANLGTADGTGWLLLHARKILHTHAHLIKDLSEKHIEKTMQLHMQQDLIIAQKDETWMDTSFGGDIRKGACIELQALFLTAVKTYVQACQRVNVQPKQSIVDQQQQTQQAVQQFVTQLGIADTIDQGATITTQRPNIAIAYYVYPELFSQQQWQQGFDILLKENICEAGIASIQKNHPLFCGYYQPKDNQSYHRGDVWLWLNNLTAICLQRINKEHFSQAIKQLTDISVKECLTQGALGHCCEVSSAQRLESFGCPMQAWSAATLIELLQSESKD